MKLIGLPSIFKIVFTLLLLSNICVAQTALILTVKTERIALTVHEPSDTLTQEVLIIFDKGNFGLISLTDTLALMSVETMQLTDERPVHIFKDLHHDNQLYRCIFIQEQGEFAMFITPCRPFKRKKLYALKITNI
jgi:hypothetical protein